MIEKRITKNKHKRSKIQNHPPIERENSFLPEFHPLSHNIFEIVAANRFVISQTAILICKSVICTEIGSAPPWMETPDALPLYEKRAGDGWRKSCPFGRNRKRERDRERRFFDEWRVEISAISIRGETNWSNLSPFARPPNRRIADSFQPKLKNVIRSQQLSIRASPMGEFKLLGIWNDIQIVWRTYNETLRVDSIFFLIRIPRARVS